MLRLPFPQSYWIDTAGLLGGFYPGDKDEGATIAKLERLRSAGVKHVVNLMEEDEQGWDHSPFRSYQAEAESLGMTTSRFPIVDVSVPTAEAMTAVLDDIDRHLEAGPVYVHCRGGRGRTGTVAGCWLVRHGIATPGDAATHLRDLVRQSGSNLTGVPETDQQLSFIRNWRPGR